MRLSLAQRIVAITAAALVPILGVLLVNEVALRRSRGAEIHELAVATAQQAALELERLTSGAEGILRTVAAAPVIQGLDREGCTAFLSKLVPDLPQFTRVSVLDLDGVAVCGSDTGIEGLDLSDRTYFTEALANDGRMVVGEFTVSRVSGANVLPLALAIRDGSGQPRGVVATSMDLRWLGGILHERQLAKNGSLTVADRNGVIIAREPEPERFVGTTIPDEFQRLVNAEEPGSVEVTSQDGTRRILGFIPASVPPVGLYISAGIARAEAFRPFNAATRRTLALGFAAALVAGALSWLLGQRLVRGPLAQIASALAARRTGNEAARTGMRAEDGEIEAVGAGFDRYMDDLNVSRQERDRAEAALRSSAAETERLAERNELLAREMSHRVMNSFQLMESLFALQTRRVTDPVAREVIAEAEERIRSMALVHRQLFQLTRDDVRQLDAGSFLLGLSRELAPAFARPEAVRIEVETEEGLLLAPAQGIALGLLVTELVLNAIKHAFRGQTNGMIRISLRADEPDRLCLVVEDDGSGLPPLEARSGATGVGMKLLDGFLRQIEGTLTVDGPPGTRFVVRFPVRAQVQEPELRGVGGRPELVG